jgi:solute carrier family 25 folate transporter 32
MASGVSWGVYFFSYNHAKNFWRQYLLHPSVAHAPHSSSSSTAPARLGPFAHLSCAAFSGTLATIFTNPFSMVKTRLQLQGKEINSNTRMYRGVFDAFVRITREEGVLTLYRGIGPSLVLVSNGALQFMSYEELKRLTVLHLIPSHEEKELNAAHFLGMGALAKVFSATVTYPMAVTRARLYQRKPDELLKVLVAADPPILPPPVVLEAAGAVPTVAPKPAAVAKSVDGKYEGMIDVITKIWRLEGWRGFYRGLTPALIKTAPSSAITFLIYETTIKLLHAEPIPKTKKFD